MMINRSKLGKSNKRSIGTSSRFAAKCQVKTKMTNIKSKMTLMIQLNLKLIN